ncbi:cytochrome c oxidase subunit 2 [Plasticicumulans lactativorans]|uniref:Cytochrome c oxidase subunit 2 n=1 Tax=Plasticicumulans lactativorans TaxID=1133106 RepID=A0A4R2LCU8_9GAMM|nr:cytochrome c oxidase subunit II [Plasticicumulans lactativorans]TCO82246.1 cytochrome c oxidase subunit 2 [Plasticicumulans lactativorans]
MSASRRVAGACGRAALAGSLLWGTVAQAAFELNMTPGATAVSRDVYHLHMTIFWICVAIGVVVFGVMFWSIYHHRKSRGAVPAQFHESTAIEIAWTVVPVMILVGMAIPATRTLVAMEDTSNPDLTVKITGYQWKWRYEYLQDGVSFYSNLKTSAQQMHGEAPKGEHYLLEVDKPLVLPVGKKVRLLTTAADVIHSWWVPALAIKKDAIPGFINEVWTRIDTPGTYRGQCAELCGKDHGFMPIVIVALNDADYAKWLADTKASLAAEADSANRTWDRAELMKKGAEVYQTCAACHQANGEGLPGVFPPLVKGKPFSGSEEMLKPLRERGLLAADNTIAAVSVEQQAAVILKGIPGTAMAAFGPQLGDVEVAALLTYIRNSWGNDLGDVVQPAAIKALR